MPIGKNSIKRVTNNGYSKVKTDAPDMENSHIEEPAAEPAKESAAIAKKPAAKASSAKGSASQTKKAPAKKAQSGKNTAAAKKSAAAQAAPKAPLAKKSAAKASAEQTTPKRQAKDLSPAARLDVVVERVAPEAAKSFVNIGDKMPTYLL